VDNVQQKRNFLCLKPESDAFTSVWKAYVGQTPGTSESKQAIPGKFCNMVLEKDGDDYLDRSCEKLRSVTESRGGEDYPTNNKKKGG
jgi:phage FluMu protein Com